MRRGADGRIVESDCSTTRAASVGTTENPQTKHAAVSRVELHLEKKGFTQTKDSIKRIVARIRTLK